MTETIGPMAARIDQKQLAREMVDQARAEGVHLVGEGGLLTGLTKAVVETALEEEMSDHLGYDKHDPAGRNGANSRNGTRSKTVLTEIGPVQIEAPRDRDGSFEPQLVRKRQRRLNGIDEIVLSLTARGLTTGEVSAHFAEVYGAKVSKDTISRITDKVVEEMTEWRSRPLDRGRFLPIVANPDGRIAMVYRAWNKSPAVTKRRYFELIRQGASGSAASQQVGVSLSCGSLWFVDAGSVSFIDKPINSRYLTQDDRIEIADGLAAGEPVKSIAARIGKSYQTVYREIARNKKPDGRYQPWYAHGQAQLRRRRVRPRRVSVDDRLRAAIAAKLDKHWSPAQISRWLRRRWPRRTQWHLCHETIYESVYRGLVVRPHEQTLRSGRTYRHKRGRGRSREGALKQSTNMKSIHIRPVVVEERTQIGHWEGDLIIGAMQRSAIATLVERKTRHTMLVPIRGGHSAQNVGDALIEVFTGLPPALRRTLTWDQGNEMFHHERIEQISAIRVYFADPHSPWQRGSNENTNGLLRQYFPKGINFDHVGDRRLREVAEELNDRPRLCLGDRSPRQLMARWHRQLITS